LSVGYGPGEDDGTGGRELIGEVDEMGVFLFEREKEVVL
jgi:hypothetical protein